MLLTSSRTQSRRSDAVTLVCAHRGGREFAPEGTLDAYRSALAVGADFVEVDVRRRADGELVCGHDTLLGAEPLLREVLELIADAGRSAHIDLKETGYEDELVGIVGGYGLRRVLYTIGDEASVRALRAAGGEALLTLGPDLADRPLLAAVRELIGVAIPFSRIGASNACGVAAQFRLAGPVLRWWCRRRGLALLVWTVNDDRRLRRFLDVRGVTAVVTDRPGHALKLRTQR